MKGVIFTEFLDLVEDKFGLETVDQILDTCGDDGVFTSVGSYDHKRLVKLIVTLSKSTGIAADTLQQVFGKTVFNNLYRSLPEDASILSCKDSFTFIRLVQDYIHIEVKKLYPDANPPEFDFISVDKTQMVFDYQSARCMAPVCFGLVEGCAEHFGESLDISSSNIEESGSKVRFTLTKA